jgi:branched-chain amino acid transport system permease protein
MTTTGVDVRSLRALVLRRLDVVALAAVLVTLSTLGGLTKHGVYLAGGIVGLGVAMQATGIVLVYRANRIINFAQIYVGVFAAEVFRYLVTQRPLVIGMAKICETCVPQRSGVGDIERLRQSIEERNDVVLSRADVVAGIIPRWFEVSHFVFAALLCLVLGLVLTAVVYGIVNLPQFDRAPRLVLTIATIGAGFLADRFGVLLINKADKRSKVIQYVEDTAVPWKQSHEIGGVVFTGSDIVAVLMCLAALLLLGLYLWRSTSGLLLRGAAENADRARTLGISPRSLTFRAWMVAGALTTVASLAAQMRAEEIDSFAYFVRALAAAAAGGFVGLPLAVIGGLGLGVSNATLLRNYGSDALLSGLLVVAIVILLLAQTSGRSTGRLADEVQRSWQAARQIRPTPKVLLGLPVVRRTRILTALVLAALVLGYPWVTSVAQLNLGTRGLTFAMIGLSLLVLTGWAGQISLGQMGLAGVAAWAVASAGIPFLLAFPVGAIAGAIAAVLVGLPALRLRGLLLAVSTMAFALSVTSVVMSKEYGGKRLPENLPRPLFLGIDLDDDRYYFYFVLLLLALVTVAVLGLRRSRLARALVACRDNERAAQSFGLNLLRVRLSAFALSGSIAGVAGVALAYSQRTVAVDTFALDASITVFLVAVVGGLGAVTGPLLGGVFYVFLGILPPAFHDGFVGIFFTGEAACLLVLLFLPGGLAQLVYGLRDAWLRRVADRARISVPALTERRTVGPTAPIAPKTTPTGATAYVPPRYSVDDQWMVDARREEVGSRG